MNRALTIGIGFWLAALTLSSAASALVVPTSIATDSRIKTVMYSPNEIYKFTGFYRYQSSVEFAADEDITTISLGDSIAWQVNPVGNRLFIKPIEQDATTNMTVITNKRTYFFELHAEETKNIGDRNLIFALRFVYPGDDGGTMMSNGIDPAPNLEQDDLSKYNFKYTMSGADEIAPVRIFDDGEFTYFEFRDKNAEVPAFFQVDSQGNEAVVNYRTRGNYIIVERVASRFTLRHGTSVTCVFNEAMYSKQPVNKKSAPTPAPAKPATTGTTPYDTYRPGQ